MENLTITNQLPMPTAPPPLGPGLAPSTQPQQLPPQMFTTAAQLLDLTDSESSYIPKPNLPLRHGVSARLSKGTRCIVT